MKEYYRKTTDYMKKTYGMDALSSFMILTGMICCLFAVLFPDGPTGFLGIPAVILMIICGLRVFSSKTEERMRENQVFCRIAAPVFERFLPPDEEKKKRLKGKKEKKRVAREEKVLQKERAREFRFFNCPNPECRQRLRVPRGNGKVEITCPNCGNRFIRKT